jgi:methylenetetrahydrofolate dehydrogenase (NADP+)/methenyltetrahydrofolate cyclohydrolase
MEDVKNYTKKWKAAISKSIRPTNIPRLAIVQVGEDEGSNCYAKGIIKDCVEVGVKYFWLKFSANITKSEFMDAIVKCRSLYDKIIVMEPLPAHIQIKEIQNDISISTPEAIVRYLEDSGWEISGKNILVIGRGNTVGRPLAQLLTDKDATVTLAHSKSRDIIGLASKADLVITAVGKKNFLDCAQIECPVIDVNGECYNTEGKEIIKNIGLLTRCMLLEKLEEEK